MAILIYFTFSSLIVQIKLSMLISICLTLLPGGSCSEFAKDTSRKWWGVENVISDAKINFLSKLIQKLCHFFHFFALIMQIYAN